LRLLVRSTGFAGLEGARGGGDAGRQEAGAASDDGLDRAVVELRVPIAHCRVG